ncbi:hypothetical protein EVA_20296 [gut metagenome]|uniref:Uncharacterized protein n=1 Tax=gut metagenome TaxID=749906 RepID=J9F9M7_9ZZZZ
MPCLSAWTQVGFNTTSIFLVSLNDGISTTDTVLS